MLVIAAKNSVSQRVLDKAHSCVRADRVAACASLEVQRFDDSTHEQQRDLAPRRNSTLEARERPRATPKLRWDAR